MFISIKLYKINLYIIVPALIFLVAFISLYSCKKSYDTEKPPKVSVTNPVDSIKIKDSIRIADSTRIADSIANSIRIIKVGNGSGDLTIDGNNLIIDGKKSTFQNGDIVKIKSGSYNDIAIKNISVPDGVRVTIINDGGIVLLSGTRQMMLTDLNNVTVSGAGTSADGRGFVFQNNGSRAIMLNGTVNNFTLQNMYFKNISDYAITYEGFSKFMYNGTSGAYVSNLAFLNLDAENTAQVIQLDGDITTSGFRGLIRGLEIAHVTCTNSNAGSVIYVGNAENFNIHDNYMNNINKTNNNHNGVFFTRGFGKFYNNIITNHQGNALRAWTYSINNTGTIEIYNNIVYNSRMYSGFEIQVPPYIKDISFFKPANAKVYNNTVGKMNTENYFFPGRLLDLYNTYGTLELYNNLVFNNNDNIILNNMSAVNIIKNQNNIYVSKEADAIVNTTSFTSKIENVGAR